MLLHLLLHLVTSGRADCQGFVILATILLLKLTSGNETMIHTIHAIGQNDLLDLFGTRHWAIDPYYLAPEKRIQSLIRSAGCHSSLLTYCQKGVKGDHVKDCLLAWTGGKRLSGILSPARCASELLWKWRLSTREVLYRYVVGLG
jgi:hypothetical protein